MNIKRVWNDLLENTPIQLKRLLLAFTALYFVGFLWVYTGGVVQRLFIPFQWKNFFEMRQIQTVLGDEWFFYGDSVLDLFANWAKILIAVFFAYHLYRWVMMKKSVSRG
ncbi:hypothetical protein WEU32_01070 [Brevundimonas sp. BH3]|uniref:hypothetical protein n=1 Tax=Brevundimonas sp. BH3 TaxID=3133089 RepID=UPI0032457D0A